MISLLISITILMLLINSLLFMFNFSNTSTIISYSMTNILPLNINLNFIFDFQSIMFSSSVSLISSFILIYSKEYINPKQYNMFSMITLIFILSMILLIHSNNIFTLILGWDGLGISSFLLVIFYQDHNSNASGMMTIITNRLGDSAIMISLTLMMMNNLTFINSNYNFPIISSLLLMLAASTKSAMFPFSAWLPAAMAAPTPISSLVHSSTLVTAGVYLLIRMSHIINNNLMIYMTLISIFTSMYASLTALKEKDMKKIIAYSTLSQIAFIMFSISLNSQFMAFFHLITHAFFKSTMFLAAGMMIYSSSYQDSRYMNNPMSMPIINSTLSITSMALMGIPFMSGFYSKDNIIDFMNSNTMNKCISFMMMISVGLTASYTFRMILINTKTKPLLIMNSFYNKFNLMNTSISILTPISIFMGALIMWKSFPSEPTILNYKMKLIILMIITMGTLMGYISQFSSYKLLKMSKSALSSWNLHIMMSLISMKFIKPSQSSLWLDNSWSESIPNKSMNNLMLQTNLYNKKLLLPSLIMISMLLMNLPNFMNSM